VARYYDVAAASLALQIPPKWLDNLLSHHSIAGVEGGRQGVTRRISREGLTRLAVIVGLTRQLRVPAAAAVSIAERLAASGHLPLTPELLLTIDLAALDRRLVDALVVAVESAATPRRGRPPRANPR
jgi:hypothetical protein